MKKYECSICGYIYDEEVGDSSNGIVPGTLWSVLSEEFECPVCGAMKFAFEEINLVTVPEEMPLEGLSSIALKGDLSAGALKALFSNLAKGCDKQFRPTEAGLFTELANYYGGKEPTVEGNLADLSEMIRGDLQQGYEEVHRLAEKAGDRGSLRTLVWGDKVTRILSSHLGRYEKQQESLLSETKIHVCAICGFIYIGDEAPDICPVCKVQKNKIIEVKRG